MLLYCWSKTYLYLEENRSTKNKEFIYIENIMLQGALDDFNIKFCSIYLDQIQT